MIHLDKIVIAFDGSKGSWKAVESTVCSKGGLLFCCNTGKLAYYLEVRYNIFAVMSVLAG